MISSDSMTVSLYKCRFFARHGVMPQERLSGNEFEVSISVRYSVSGPNDDNLESTVSYADLYELATKEMDTPCQLLETVARRIADSIELTWPWAEELNVEICKLTPPIPGITGYAGVRLNRLIKK